MHDSRSEVSRLVSGFSLWIHRIVTKQLRFQFFCTQSNFPTYPRFWQVWGLPPPPLPISEISDVAHSVCFWFWAKLKRIYYSAIFYPGWPERSQPTDSRAEELNIFVRWDNETSRRAPLEKTLIFRIFLWIISQLTDLKAAELELTKTRTSQPFGQNILRFWDVRNSMKRRSGPRPPPPYRAEVLFQKTSPSWMLGFKNRFLKVVQSL